MKQVVGPFLTEFLRPIYVEPLNDDEISSLPPVHRVRGITYFASRLGETLLTRIHSQSGHDMLGRSRIASLVSNRPDLFYFNDSTPLLREAVHTGVVTPLTVS